ncbi:hypothetical protein [Methylobacterium terrae]|uniref:hypothetical protein n=1 Tax=Methylobacterium terrae TaxID=2202827 RepID=UPI0013A58AE0|nr:hypothetical protein [Methylobacterium terrae]
MAKATAEVTAKVRERTARQARPGHARPFVAPRHIRTIVPPKGGATGLPTGMRTIPKAGAAGP